MGVDGSAALKEGGSSSRAADRIARTSVRDEPASDEELASTRRGGSAANKVPMATPAAMVPCFANIFLACMGIFAS